MIYIPDTNNKFSHVVDGKEIDTYQNRIGELGHTLGVEIGSNGYGDGRTYFSLSDLGRVNLQANVDKNVFVEKSDGTIVEIMLHGDAELRMFIKSLKWTLQALETILECQRRGDIF